jgi:hypothetical protein
MTGYRRALRDLTLLLCASFGVLLFSQIPAVVSQYAAGASDLARTALDTLQKRFPEARKDLRGFIAKTQADSTPESAPIRQVIASAEALNSQALHLRSASWWEQPVMLAKQHDKRLLRGALVSYRPTLTLHPAWAGIGLLWGWLSFAALSWLGRKVFGRRRG